MSEKLRIYSRRDVLRFGAVGLPALLATACGVNLNSTPEITPTAELSIETPIIVQGKLNDGQNDPGVYVITVKTDGPVSGVTLKALYRPVGSQNWLSNELGVPVFTVDNGPRVDTKSLPKGEYEVQILARTGDPLHNTWDTAFSQSFVLSIPPQN